MAEWYLYLVRCRDDSLYTGIATDVARRFAEHCSNGKKRSKYLRSRMPITLVFQARIGSRNLALKVEKWIKMLPKDKKEKLITSASMLREIIKAVK